MEHSNYIKDKHKNIEDYNYQKSRNNDSFCWFDCNSKKKKQKQKQKQKTKTKKTVSELIENLNCFYYTNIFQI